MAGTAQKTLRLCGGTEAHEQRNATALLQSLRQFKAKLPRSNLSTGYALRLACRLAILRHEPQKGRKTLPRWSAAQTKARSALVAMSKQCQQPSQSASTECRLKRFPPMCQKRCCKPELRPHSSFPVWGCRGAESGPISVMSCYPRYQRLQGGPSKSNKSRWTEWIDHTDQSMKKCMKLLSCSCG